MHETSKIGDNSSELTNHQTMVGNKIRVQYNIFNLDHIAFVETLTSLLTQLAQYIKSYHLVGVTWNPKGGDVSNYTPGAASSTKVAAPAAGGMANTWRKDYKAEGTVPTPAAPAAAKKPAAPVKIAKPPVCEERNGNWQIEYQTGPEPLTVSGINMKQQVYIFGCEGATILLEGKAKNIVLDSCKKTKLVFDNSVSSIEIVNCKGVQVQCKGVVPSVAIDKTDGCLVYISWEGREVQFVTSKSSEMNVAFPHGAGSDDYVEKPIPEQFVHKIMDDLAISSDVSALYSH
ncbi:hypothetical protein JG688_00004612 [Phytophthora aleatoria]|uniref:C-CAP/cofactor C-like domain-containing protein n=1 Tax=Phytophthora aleatoria TaxID=2496075 RepID=A0A8J5MB72_9STRA|nr:hypothetical protein JG688_00004612 [Phytophthora aleatoria]